MLREANADLIPQIGVVSYRELTISLRIENVRLDLVVQLDQVELLWTVTDQMRLFDDGNVFLVVILVHAICFEVVLESILLLLEGSNLAA